MTVRQRKIETRCFVSMFVLSSGWEISAVSKPSALVRRAIAINERLRMRSSFSEEDVFGALLFVGSSA